MQNRLVKNIVIVGGGTAGWMAAAAISEKYKEQVSNNSLSIHLVESSQIGTVGVGEATVPGILIFHQHLGISERDFIKATGATFKLGIEFKDWYKNNVSFFHPFAAFGAKIENQDFYQCWLKTYKEGYHSGLEDYCLAIAMAKNGKFAQPDDNAKTTLALYSYAYHFDASLYARYLRSYAESRKVKRVDAKVERVNLSESGQEITSITLQDGSEITGDLFIDCTGFRAMLIGEALQCAYENWQHYLPCDTAVAAQTELKDEPAPFTRSTAMKAGWRWQIPLQHRMGNGYVYSSQYCSDGEAKEEFLASLDSKPLTEPKIIRFTAGMRESFWKGNCVALGLASGFIEPLESTSISLIQTGVEKLLQFMPDLKLESAKIKEANRLNRLEYERVRDFIILHYKANQREGGFWEQVRNMEIPESLDFKIKEFKKDGTIHLMEQESFQEQSWLAMYNGFRCVPHSCKLGVQELDSNKIKEIMRKMQRAIKNGAECAPTHSQFLASVYE